MSRAEEFLALKRELLKKHEKEMNDLCVSFATREVKYKVGDVATDGTNTIRVDRYSVAFPYFEDVPDVKYHGALLTKALAPRKDEKRGSVFQSHTEI